jgi:hypothetical protein
MGIVAACGLVLAEASMDSSMIFRVEVKTSDIGSAGLSVARDDRLDICGVVFLPGLRFGGGKGSGTGGRPMSSSSVSSS